MVISAIVSTRFIRIQQERFCQFRRCAQSGGKRHIFVLTSNTCVSGVCDCSFRKLDFTGYPIPLQGICRSRIDQGSVCFDSFPLRRLRSHVGFCQHTVRIRDNLNLSVFQSHASAPLPYVSVEVCDSIRHPVMVPGCRSRAGSAPRRFSWMAVCFCAFIRCRDALLVRIGNILSPVIVSSRHGFVLTTPQGDCAPQRIRNQAPSVSFVAAECQSLVEIHISLRITHGETVCTVIQNNALVLPDINLILVHPAYFESRMYILAASIHNVGNIHLRKRNHDRGHFHVIKKDGILTARHRFNR